MVSYPSLDRLRPTGDPHPSVDLTSETSPRATQQPQDAVENSVNDSSSGASTAEQKLSLDLQRIIDNQEFASNVDYAVVKQIRRAVNPGITLSPEVFKKRGDETLIRRFRDFFFSDSPSKDRVRIKHGDIIPLPLNDSAATELTTLMRPVPKSVRNANDDELSSWYLPSEEFELHDFPDWEEQLETVMEQACKSLGVDQISKSITIAPHCLMLHIGSSRAGSLSLWNKDSSMASADKFAVLRFILPSARLSGVDEVKLLQDSVTASCNENAQFCTYYVANYVDVEHSLSALEGVRLELVYMLCFKATANSPSTSILPRAPTVQDRAIRLVKGWNEGSLALWTACKLEYAPTAVENGSVDLKKLPAADARRLLLLDHLSGPWKFQYFIAHVMYLSNSNNLRIHRALGPPCTSILNASGDRMIVGRLKNLEGVSLNIQHGRYFDLLRLLLDADDDHDGSEKEQAWKTVLFLWPTRLHGEHVEPLAEGDSFLRQWLVDHKIDPKDPESLGFDSKADEDEFRSLALSLCKRGSSQMKPFCLEASLRIQSASLLEAALPEIRSVDMMREGVEHLGLKRMQPIVLKTLGLGVPNNPSLHQWCKYLVELSRKDRKLAYPLLQELVTQMTKRSFVAGVSGYEQHPTISSARFFYENGFPEIAEKLLLAIPYHSELWLPLLPKLRALCEELGNMSWFDRALSSLVKYHQLPMLSEFKELRLKVAPSRQLEYAPASIEILRICTEYKRNDLVDLLFQKFLEKATDPSELATPGHPLEDRKAELRFLKALMISTYNVLSSIEDNTPTDVLQPDPHGVFFGTILTKYLLPALGPRPARKRYPKVKCPVSVSNNNNRRGHTGSSDASCQFCTLIDRFLQKDATDRLVFDWLSREAYHTLVDHVPPRDDLAITRDISRDPPDIVLRKTHGLVTEKWEAEQTALRELVGYIKPKRILRAALGEDYAHLEAALKPGPGGVGWTLGVVEPEGIRAMRVRIAVMGGCDATKRRRADGSPGGPRKRIRKE